MNSEWDEKAQAEARARHDAEYQALIDGTETADERALEIASDLEEMWLGLQPGKTADDFEAEIHDPFDRDQWSVDEMEQEYSAFEGDMREFTSWSVIELTLRIAYGHMYAARLAVACKAEEMAWNSVEEAAFWQGVCVTHLRMGARTGNKLSASDVARNAAHAKNAENRAIKASAFEWLNGNFETCSSKDDAARKLTKIVPVVFRTAQRYVSQWYLSRH
ncbi:TPA: hypothetical protein QDB15_006011 [Burkholderia vietnamiensis]|uniref:hypothetical protein n=1 Tax=Burkholderia vietnamiensis TaxID=60552 RepID=UPI0015933A61|nr:hypothetical protein [Burkholderia vietnamiensis]MCA8207145.1 hypothetical protein [Burkholderia vietnamiensis]HDR9101153.1 hypothetical protein [Burkholderia vietnamiensis]HDR9122139.1 hypothetical protein [Burkholderia vietnamiensis]HDR9167971.1 hypothetical protein [Burkholderia vietnamiensis]HDR9281536.1 hypothetical protein [Burkholderia vietnamiensis]